MKRSSPVTRWMNKYMGLIIQIEKEHERVDYRISNQRKRTYVVGGWSKFILYMLYFFLYGAESTTLKTVCV